MRLSKSKKLLVFSSILLIFIDQLSKYIIRTSRGFYICNKGIAFGVVLPSWLILLATIAIISFIGLLILNLKFETCLPIGKVLNQFSNSKIKNLNFPLILVISGAISNLLDRLYNGCVIDFIDLKVWPVFNLADSFIFLGILALLIQINRKN